MAQSVVYQGAWQSSYYQGAWQGQAQELSHQTDENVAVADSVSVSIKSSSAEHIAVADSLMVVVKHTEPESVAVQDAQAVLIKHAESESIGVADAATAEQGITVSEHIEVSDSVSVDIIHSEPEQIKVSDSLGVKIIASQSESIAVSDQLTVVIRHEESENIGVDDAVSTGQKLTTSEHIAVSDALSVVLKHTEAEDVVVSDSQSGTLESAIQDPSGAAVAFTGTLSSRRKHPRQGVKQIGTSADPILAVTTSSNATTFTKTSVTDAAAWDLSRVEAGYILVTEDGYSGIVLSTEGNTVYVNSWVRSGVDRRGIAEDKPDDGSICTVHIVAEAQMISICANSSNTGSMYLAFVSDVDAENGHPIVKSGTGSEVTITAVHGQKLDLTRIWVVAPISQKADWVLDGYSVDGKLLWAGEEVGKLIQHTVDERIVVSDSLSVAAWQSKVLSFEYFRSIFDFARFYMIGGTDVPFDDEGDSLGYYGQVGIRYIYKYSPTGPHVDGYRYRYFLRFPLDAIPPSAILKKAELRVGIYKSETKDGAGLVPTTIGDIWVHRVSFATVDFSTYQTPTLGLVGTFTPPVPMAVVVLSATNAVAACWPPPGHVCFSFRPSIHPDWYSGFRPACWYDVGDPYYDWCHFGQPGGIVQNVEETVFVGTWFDYKTELAVWYVVP